MCRLQSTLAAAPSSVAGKCLETNFLSEIGQHRALRQATEFGEKRLGGEGEALFPAKDESRGGALPPVRRAGATSGPAAMTTGRHSAGRAETPIPARTIPETVASWFTSPTTFGALRPLTAASSRRRTLVTPVIGSQEARPEASPMSAGFVRPAGPPGEGSPRTCLGRAA